jgi:uncharacterized membrane protein YjjP (DUF1212 family)
MGDEARNNLVIACAQLLYVNGQGTEQVLAAAQRLARVLDLRAALSLRWGELQLQLEEGQRPIWQVAANPAGVDMTRVTAGMRVIDDVEARRLTPEAALKAIDAISRSPAFPTWLFALASGAGAVAMAVIFGIQHVVDASLIFVSAFVGTLLRRRLHQLGTNPLSQPFCASLLAGAFAALAFRYQLITSLRFVALCPCVILVPGAHVLNGLGDLINGRLHLGAARLIHAGLITAAITTGLLFGLVLCGASLPLTEATRTVPLWQHMLAGGVAVAAFGVLFSMPLRELPVPVVVGAFAQALRWLALDIGFGVGAAALVASFAIGCILIPVARRQRLPFAAIGFIAIVAMIPGSYLFTMAGGLVQIATGQDTTLELIGVTVASGTNAMLIILAISLGLVIPKLALDYLDERNRSGPTQRNIS